MKVVEIDRKPNADAIGILEDVLDRVRCGDIVGVSISWLTKEPSIGGVISEGPNKISLWAAMEHTSRSFYADHFA